MNRIDELFSKKKREVLNLYCTAGYPFADSTTEVMKALQDHGADLIELGMPYSDPLADGPVIQASSTRAIAQGMTLKKLLADLKDFRQTIHVPVVLMGYMNTVLQYGFEQFCADAAERGIDGLILPDLPMHEYETVYRRTVEDNHLKFIFLVTPETSDERIRQLDALSSGFLYAVSSSSTTGNEKALEQQQDYFIRLESMRLKNPVLVGFGIKDKSTFLTACKHTSGAIIGSAYIRALEKVTPPIPDRGGIMTSGPSLTIDQVTKNFIDAIIR